MKIGELAKTIYKYLFGYVKVWAYNCHSMIREFDVAIIGGGPAGSTAGTLLRKYDDKIKVGIFEREQFPRDHVGESQLPAIGPILSEMGVWDKVEAANFPIKLGATFRWGKTKDLWDFQFMPKDQFQDEPRPAKYEGQRRLIAFQVDRSVYDEILLNHAGELGCEVHQKTGVSKINFDGDRIESLTLSDGSEVRADYYIDASGHAGILRRSLGIEIEQPSSLQNVAFWDYWQNAEWATEIGVGGTFVQVMSLGYGWIWFIPLGPTRTSVGLIVPAEYYKKSGKKPEELYAQALKEDERISFLMRNATSEGLFATTKDWSFVASKHAGSNWFLAGESGGFADPILAAGLTITHISAKEAASTILELRRGRLDEEWLKEQYEARQKSRLRNHIRFADFWYTSNGHFEDLKEFTSELAKESGLDLDPESAWRWIAQGGFIDEDLSFGAGVYALETVKNFRHFLRDMEVDSVLDKYNVVHLQLGKAKKVKRAVFGFGNVTEVWAYEREGKVLPIRDVIEPLLAILNADQTLQGVINKIFEMVHYSAYDDANKQLLLSTAFNALESMIRDGWIEGRFDPRLPRIKINDVDGGLTWSDSTTLGVAHGSA